MKCPYAVTRITKTHYTNHFSEEGYNDFSDTFEINSAQFVNCEEEDCAASQNGKCCYRGME